MIMSTTTIRVATETRDRLNALARRRGIAASALVAELVQQAEDQSLLGETEESWSRIANDAAALSAYRAEATRLQSFDEPLPE
jgi:hypothetical protein